MSWWVTRLGLIVLEIPSATPTAVPDVYPAQTNGFAAEIVPALFAIAVLALFAIWLSSKPKRGRPARGSTGRRNRRRGGRS